MTPSPEDIQFCQRTPIQPSPRPLFDIHSVSPPRGLFALHRSEARRRTRPAGSQPGNQAVAGTPKDTLPALRVAQPHPSNQDGQTQQEGEFDGDADDSTISDDGEDALPFEDSSSDQVHHAPPMTTDESEDLDDDEEAKARYEARKSSASREFPALDGEKRLSDTPTRRGVRDSGGSGHLTPDRRSTRRTRSTKGGSLSRGSRLDQISEENKQGRTPAASPSFIRKTFNKKKGFAGMGRAGWAVARTKVRERALKKAVAAAFPEKVVFGMEGEKAAIANATHHRIEAQRNGLCAWRGVNALKHESDWIAGKGHTGILAVKDNHPCLTSEAALESVKHLHLALKLAFDYTSKSTLREASERTVIGILGSHLVFDALGHKWSHEEVPGVLAACSEQIKVLERGVDIYYKENKLAQKLAKLVASSPPRDKPLDQVVDGGYPANPCGRSSNTLDNSFAEKCILSYLSIAMYGT